MKKIMTIVLVSLLGFLGCSDGDDGTTTVGKANPVAPFGIVEPPIHTYEWTPVSGATRYRLIVQETNREGTTMDTEGTNIIDKWHTSEEAGCASEESLCMVTPDIELHGEHEFKVQACANLQCSKHSDPMAFHSTAMIGPRFHDHGNGTATDLKTFLMWTTNGQLCRDKPWFEAMAFCENVELGAYYGEWRLPTLHELYSLVDKHEREPALPPGNPFTNVQKYFDYWSSIMKVDKPHRKYWVLSFFNGDNNANYDRETNPNFVWCVRSGN